MFSGDEVDRIKSRIKFRGDIGTSEIEEAYRKAFNMSKPNIIKRLLLRLLRVGNPISLPFLFADTYYKEASFAIIGIILKEDKPKLKDYIYKPEELDCDDYAFRLMGIFHQDHRTIGMPIFITWVETPEGGHAVLSYYYKGIIEIIEPQNCNTFSVPKDWKLWLIIG